MSLVSSISNSIDKVKEKLLGKIPNYLRKWKVLVTAENGNKSLEYDLSDLRCTFEVKADVTTPRVQCTLEIYNLNNTTANTILSNGFSVELYAGYNNSRYGKIFDGDIVQSFRNYHDGIDDVVQILALSGDRMLYNNFVSVAIAGGQTAKQGLEMVAKEAGITIKTQDVEEELTEREYPRGRVVFGDTAEVIQKTADEVNATCQIDNQTKRGLGGIEIVSCSADKVHQYKALDLNYQNGLIGSPVYSNEGIHITSLLDSRIKPYSLIKVNNNYLERTYGAVNQLGIIEQDRRLIDPDGEYRVFSVKHTGDTYGDTWQTEVVGVGRDRSIKDMAIIK